MESERFWAASSYISYVCCGYTNVFTLHYSLNYTFMTFPLFCMYIILQWFIKIILERSILSGAFKLILSRDYVFNLVYH